VGTNALQGLNLFLPGYNVSRDVGRHGLEGLKPPPNKNIAPPNEMKPIIIALLGLGLCFLLDFVYLNRQKNCRFNFNIIFDQLKPVENQLKVFNIIFDQLKEPTAGGNCFFASKIVGSNFSRN